MSVSPPRRLPRGRNALSREEVERVQRDRLMVAMAEVMSEKGFVRTSVEDVLKRGAVSRQSFYQLFSSKIDCFMAALDVATELLEALAVAARDEANVGASGPLERFEWFVTAYLEGMAAEPAFARLFVVEVFAAGPEAINRRIAFQRRMAHALANLFGIETEAGRFACEMVVAATSMMVTGPLMADDPDALRAVGPPVVEHVRRLAASGAFRSDEAPES